MKNVSILNEYLDYLNQKGPIWKDELMTKYINLSNDCDFGLFTKQKDGTYSCELEIPGFKKEEIKVEIEEDLISIIAKNNKKNLHYNLVLDEDKHDLSSLKVKLELGVLTLTVDSSKPKVTKKQVIIS